MNTNLDSKLGQGTSERGRSQVKTHLSTVIFNDRFTARILGYSSNFLKSVEKNSRERVRFIPIRPLVERIPMVSRNSKKKGNSRRDLPKGEKLPRSISHGQLPRRYSPNIDCASAPKANLRLSRSREKAFTLFYNAIRQNQSSIPIVFLVQRLRDPDFVENFEERIPRNAEEFPIDSIRQPRDTKRTCDRNIISSFHYVRRENDQEWGVISCFV